MNIEAGPEEYGKLGSQSKHAVQILFWIVVAVILLLGLTKLNSYFHWMGFLADEGIHLNSARRVLDGQVIYRDFPSGFMPGQTYLTALTFKAFGTNLQSARLMIWAIYVVTVLAFIGLADQLQIRRSFTLIGVLAFFAVGPPFYCLMLSHHFTATAATLASAWMLLKAERGHPMAWRMGAGAMGCLTALMMQDQGAYWLLLSSAVLYFAGKPRGLNKVGPYILGASLLGIPILIYFLSAVGITALWNNVVILPLTSYYKGGFNHQPYGWGWDADWSMLPKVMKDLHSPHAAWIGLLIVCLTAVYILVMWSFPVGTAIAAVSLWRRRRDRQEMMRVLVLTSLVLSLLLSALHHPVIETLVYRFSGPLLVLLWFAERLCTRRNSAAAAVEKVSTGILCLGFLMLGLDTTVVRHFMAPSELVRFPAGTLAVTNADDLRAFKLAISFRSQLYQPGDVVYCCNMNPTYYFLLGLKSPTQYDQFIVPQASAEQVNVVLETLKRAPPQWVLWDGIRYSADPILDWIQANYVSYAGTEKLFILRLRKGGPTSFSK